MLIAIASEKMNARDYEVEGSWHSVMLVELISFIKERWL